MGHTLLIFRVLDEKVVVNFTALHFDHSNKSTYDNQDLIKLLSSFLCLFKSTLTFDLVKVLYPIHYWYSID
ncbi:hypothetical protein BLOT_014003 [Blomia tropicalis]|nr:hypothetical protein BLOT_014003 [Blomia tropicalis]